MTWKKPDDGANENSAPPDNSAERPKPDDALDIARRNLESLKLEVSLGTHVDPELIAEMERGIAQLEASRKARGF